VSSEIGLGHFRIQDWPTTYIYIYVFFIFKISEDEIVGIIEKILNWSISTVVTREYAINALMKLSTRFPNSSEYV